MNSVVEIASTQRHRRKDGSLSPALTLKKLLEYRDMANNGELASEIKSRFERAWVQMKGRHYYLMMELRDE